MSLESAAMADVSDLAAAPGPAQTFARDNVSPNASQTEITYPNIDHRGNPIMQYVGGGNPEPGGYAQTYGPAASSRRMSPIPPLTPEKGQLRTEIQQLRDELQVQQQRAFNVISHQQDGFQAHAQQFEQAARDVTQVEVARSEANVKAQYQSQLNRAEAVVQRTGQRLQDQQQKAAADQHKIKTEARQAQCFISCLSTQYQCSM